MATNDPVEDAACQGEEQDKRNDFIQEEEDCARAYFFAQAVRADANAVCTWASTIKDYGNTASVSSAEKLPRRYRTFSEIMFDTLDMGNGPSMSELMQMLLNAASGHTLTQKHAQELLANMAEQYVKYEVK